MLVSTLVLKQIKKIKLDPQLEEIFDHVSCRRNKLAKDCIAKYTTENPSWKSGAEPSILHHACGVGNLAIVKYLTDDLSYPIDQLANWGHSAGVNKSTTPLCISALNGSLSIVAHLVGKGADVNKRSANGETALISACSTGNVDMTQYLIEAGASIELTKSGDVSPLMIACQNEHLAVVQLLIEYGADIKRKDIRGSSAAFYCKANKSEHVLKFLLSLDLKLLCEKTYHGETLTAYIALYGSDSVINFIKETYICNDSQQNTLSSAQRIEFLELLASSKFMKKTFSLVGVELMRQAVEIQSNLGSKKDPENIQLEDFEAVEFERVEALKSAVENLDFEFILLQVFLVMKRNLGLSHEATLNGMRNYLRNINDAAKFRSIYVHVIKTVQLENQNSAQIRGLIEEHANFFASQSKSATQEDLILALVKAQEVIRFYQESDQQGSCVFGSQVRMSFLSSLCRFLLAFMNKDGIVNSDLTNVQLELKNISNLIGRNDESMLVLLRLILDPATYKLKLGKRVAEYPKEQAVQLVAEVSDIAKNGESVKHILENFKANCAHLCTSRQRNVIYSSLKIQIEE